MNPTNEKMPVDNQVYNLIRATAEKLKSLAAYNKYAQDGNEQVWQNMKRQDEQSVTELLAQLKQCADQGKFEKVGGGMGSERPRTNDKGSSTRA